MTHIAKNFSDNVHWNDYGAPFSATTTIYQSELYRDIASKLCGRVADYGCGSAKLAAYLADKPAVTAYFGIEHSPDMVAQARQLINKLAVSDYQVLEKPIEAFEQHNSFDSAVSTNSYYAWSNPEANLKTIYQSLKPGAIFILATPNREIDMQALFKEAEKDLIMHPYYEQFKQSNMNFAEQMQCNFVPMHTLVEQMCAVGFKIKVCHSNYFAGGVNYIQADK